MNCLILISTNPNKNNLLILIKLAYFYGVTTDYLLGVNDRKISSIDIAGLNEEQIQSLLNIIHEFKKTENKY